uniref:Transmembrane protein 147 n=1 Tax=Meloidogyne hapla TaxID=6305 RepID=A0A1I8B5M2_MELHA
MFEFLKCWFIATCRFVEETVRLQGYGAIPYLMAINSLFCFVCFYASREVQLRVLYGLVGSILVKDLILTKKRQHPMLAVLSWCFADVFRSISVGLFLYSVQILTEGIDERKAFFASLAAADSEHEFDEFLPSDFENDGENEHNMDIEINENRINNRREDVQGHGNNKKNNNGLGLDEISSISSQLSFDDEEEANALLSGLRQIDISETDSDTDAFLPSFAIKKRRDKNPIGEF